MKPPYLRVVFYTLAGLVLLVAGLIYALLSSYLYLEPRLPDVATLREVQLQVPLRVYSRDGRLIAQIGEYRRIPVSYEQVPERLVQAVLAAEDDRFFAHHGVDYAGLARAIPNYLVYGQHSRAGGGGTITMQLARNIFLTPEFTPRRKLSEIFLSLRIERGFNKQDILTLYLNKIFLGQRAYGVAAAAEVYFGKTLQDLTLAETATIAGLPQAPSRDNPIASPERAKQRRLYVLRRMHETGVITEEEYESARNEPLVAQLHGPAAEIDAPYVAEMARADAFQKYGERIYTDGYKVVTTIDSRLQSAATTALRLGLIEYDRRHGFRGPLAHIELPTGHSNEQLAAWLEKYGAVGRLEPALITTVAEQSARVVLKNGDERPLEWEGLSWARRVTSGGLGPQPKTAADVLQTGDIVYVVRTDAVVQLVQLPLAQSALVALDPRDGAIVALEGGFDFFASKYNRAIQAKRQPGSAFKPFLYSAALEHGFTPASVILDAPVVFEDDAAEDTWRPENSTGEFYGPTRLREALVRSRNLVSVRLMRSMGVPYTMDYLTSRFGFAPERLPRDLSLALGTLQLSPAEVAGQFATFANGGFRVQPYYIERIEDGADRVVYESKPRIACPECREALPAQPVDSGPTAAAQGAPVQPFTQSPVATPSPSTTPSTEGAVTATGQFQSDNAPAGFAALAPDRIAPRAISAQNAYLMRDMMRDVIRRGTAKRASVLGRNDLAGKTGTTNDHHDAWFCGFNSNLVAAVWVGFDQEASLGAGEEGGRTAVPIWVDFMREALKGTPEAWPPAPDGLVAMRISARTGQLASASDPDAIVETFIETQRPAVSDPLESGPASHSEASSDEPLF